MNKTGVAGQLATVLARQPKAFAEALRILDALTEPTPEERLSRIWMIDAVEARYPKAADAVADAYLKAETTGADVDYVAVLLTAAGL